MSKNQNQRFSIFKYSNIIETWAWIFQFVHADLLDLPPEVNWKQVPAVSERVWPHAGPQCRLVSSKMWHCKTQSKHNAQQRGKEGLSPCVSDCGCSKPLQSYACYTACYICFWGIKLRHSTVQLKDGTIFYSRVIKQRLSLVWLQPTG